MTDQQSRDIVYAIVGGAFLIAIAIHPPIFSFGDVLIGIGGLLLFGLVALGFYLWEKGWLWPLVIALTVAIGIYYAGPIGAWLSAKPSTPSTIGAAASAAQPSTAEMDAWINQHRGAAAAWIKANGGDPTPAVVDAWIKDNRTLLYRCIQDTGALSPHPHTAQSQTPSTVGAPRPPN